MWFSYWGNRISEVFIVSFTFYSLKYYDDTIMRKGSVNYRCQLLKSREGTFAVKGKKESLFNKFLSDGCVIRMCPCVQIHAYVLHHALNW